MYTAENDVWGLLSKISGMRGRSLRGGVVGHCVNHYLDQWRLVLVQLRDIFCRRQLGERNSSLGANGWLFVANTFNEGLAERGIKILAATIEHTIVR